MLADFPNQTPSFASEVMEVVENCRQLLATGRARLIAIDGRDGSGKSTFARYLAHALGVICFETDAFLIPGRGFKYRKTLRKLLHYRLARNEVAIVEGVLVGETLAGIGLQPDLLIRLKRVGQSGQCFPQERFASYERHFVVRDVVILPCFTTTASAYDCLLIGGGGQPKCSHCVTPAEAKSPDASLWWETDEPSVAEAAKGLAE